MKRIYMVQELVRKALEKGNAHITKKGDTVYKAHVDTNDDKKRFTLVHYGTIILEYDMANKEIIDWGGWSNSDRDALNNTLDVLGHNEDYFRIKDRTLELVSC
jgi:hypothetical protein